MSGEILTAPRAALSRATLEGFSEERREPTWLRALRARAAEAFERLPLPDQRTEGWRRTSLRGLPLDGLDPAALGQVRANIRHGALPGGALVMDFQAALEHPLLAGRVQQHLGSVVQPDVDKFVALHYALFNAGVVIFAPRGAAVEEPIWITYDAHGPSLVHTLVIADAQSDVRVIEEFRGGSAIASGVVEQVIGPNAHVRYVQVQRFAEDVWNFSTQRAHLAVDASLRTLNMALGSRLARNTIQVVLEGDRSQADLLAIVDANGRQHVDFETLQDHFGNATRSDLVIHDALRDSSSANFTGLIRINKPAHQTESSQEQKNVLLSDHARADSDPKLEILNNDVIRCTHGAAVGPVDPEMVFYLQSRGLDRGEAEQLIVDGFFTSVLKKLQLPAIEDDLWSALAASEAHAA